MTTETTEDITGRLRARTATGGDMKYDCGDEAADEIERLREALAMAAAALRCALAPEADRLAAEGFTEVALAYLMGFEGDYTAMQEAERT